MKRSAASLWPDSAAGPHPAPRLQDVELTDVSVQQIRHLAQAVSDYDEIYFNAESRLISFRRISDGTDSCQCVLHDGYPSAPLHPPLQRDLLASSSGGR